MKQMKDSVFEALFRQAVIDDYIEEIDSIPPKEKLMEIISFSPEFELRMNKLFIKEQRKDFLKKALSYSKRVAAILVIAITVFFGILLSSPEVRAVVKNTIVEWYDKFTSFIFQSENISTNEMKDWKPEYLPTGYHENTVEKLGKAINIEYIDDQGNTIYLSYRPEINNTSISIDNENHIVESEIINGHEVYIAKATNDDFENGVIWNMEGYTFSIWSKLSVDEILKIMQSLYE